RATKKPIYVDCNAVAPPTAEEIGAILAGSGGDYVDGGIIGAPPTPTTPGARLYVSGARAKDVGRLNAYGLDGRFPDGPSGAASAGAQLPKMPPKACGGVAEVEEIGAFLDGVAGGRNAYEAIARFYERIAEVEPQPRKASDEVASLEAFCATEAKPARKSA